MATPVSLALKAEGVAQVKEALRGVKQSFVEMERDSLAATRDASKQRVAILKDETKAKIALLKDESKARLEIAESERSFKRTLNKKESEYGMGAAGKALVKGESFDGIMRAAGAAGIAVAMFSGAIHLASASLKQFSSFVINDVIKPGMELQTRAMQVANNSNGKLTDAQVQSKARAVGVRNNMDPMAMIEAAGVFQDLTGEPGVGFDVMNTIATISKGRGFDPKELSAFAGSLYKPGMKASELSDLLLMQTAQGTSGSVTIGQLAKLGGKVTAPANTLAGDYSTRIAMTGALLQSGRKGFGSVEEAATGLGSFMTDAMLHGKAMSPKSFMKDASGVEKLADPAKFIADVYRKTSGNASKLHAMQFSEPTTKLIGAYKETYGEAFNASKAGGKTDAAAREDAAKAVEEFIKTFATANTTMAAEENRRDAVLRTSGERFATGMTAIKDKLLDNVLPGAERLADAFVEHSGEIVSAATLLAGMLGDLAQSTINVIEWWDKLTNKKGEGDVLKTVVDKGKDTVLPNMTGVAKGYWMHDKGVYKYIQGSQDQSVDDTANKGLRKQFSLPSGVGIYERDNGKGPIDPSRISSYFTPGPNASVDPSLSTNATDGANATQSTQAAASSADDLAENATKASDAMGRLSSQIDDLATRMDGLNRTTPFTG